MSNQVFIYPTKFSSLNLDGAESDVSWGLRVADDHDSTYSNLFTEEDIVGKTPAQIVELARGIDDRARDMLDFAEENKEGIFIGDEFFEWDAITGSPQP